MAWASERASKKARIAWLLSVLAVSWFATAEADIDVAVGTSDPALVFQNRVNDVRLRWSVNVSFKAPPNLRVDRVFSNQLVIGIPSGNGCAPLQAFPTTVSGTFQLNGAPPYGGAATLSEKVAIPPALVVAARRRGANVVALCRIFGESLSPSRFQARLELPIQSGGIGSNEFALSFIRMRFDDGAVNRVVAAGTQLGIHAEVQYDGRGLLRARWEVAEPGSTQGTPVYRPLLTVHRYLDGNGRAVLNGPLLPTHVSGLYLVRLRVLEPAIDGEGLILRYFVQGDGNRLPIPQRIVIKTPGPGARLGKGDSLEWSAVEGAAAYRIEYRGAEEGAFGTVVNRSADESPIQAGQLVAGGQSKAVFSPLVMERMKDGLGWWRVVAFDAEGRTIAASEWRRFWRGGGTGGGGNGGGP